MAAILKDVDFHILISCTHVFNGYFLRMPLKHVQQFTRSFGTDICECTYTHTHTHANKQAKNYRSTFTFCIRRQQQNKTWRYCVIREVWVQADSCPHPLRKWHGSCDGISENVRLNVPEVLQKGQTLFLHYDTSSSFSLSQQIPQRASVSLSKNDMENGCRRYTVNAGSHF